MLSPPQPTLATVATLCYKGTGQTLPLLPGATIVLGRNRNAGILSPHVSRHQVEVITSASHVFEVTAVRRGGNRSFLNDKELLKDVPTVLHDGDIITLLERDKFPITFDIKQPEVGTTARGESIKSSQGSVKVLRTQESLPPSAAPITSLPKSLVDDRTPSAIRTVAHAPTAKDKAEENPQTDLWKRFKESAADANKMDLDEPISENTSESGKEDRPALAEASRSAPSSTLAEFDMDEDYFSDESSVICGDFSDLDITSYDVVEVQSDSDH